MIRVEEISIGDWVNVPNYYWDESPHVGQVDGIIKRHGTYYLQFSSAFSAEIDRCKPIPITPEIIEKNGFELKPDGWLWSNEGLEEQNYIFIQFRKGCDGVRNCEINFIHRAQVTFKQLYFVHELQHALKLCGIPKNIEL